MHAHYQEIAFQELIWVLSWNFHRLLQGEDHLAKRQYVHTTASTTVTTTFTTTTSSTFTTTTSSITTTCKAKSVGMKISRKI